MMLWLKSATSIIRAWKTIPSSNQNITRSQGAIEDKEKGINSDSTVARTIIEERRAVQVSGQQKRRIVEGTRSLKPEATPEASAATTKGATGWSIQHHQESPRHQKISNTPPHRAPKKATSPKTSTHTPLILHEDIHHLRSSLRKKI